MTQADFRTYSWWRPRPDGGGRQRVPRLWRSSDAESARRHRALGGSAREGSRRSTESGSCGDAFVEDDDVCPLERELRGEHVTGMRESEGVVDRGAPRRVDGWRCLQPVAREHGASGVKGTGPLDGRNHPDDVRSARCVGGSDRKFIKDPSVDNEYAQNTDRQEYGMDGVHYQNADCADSFNCSREAPLSSE